MQNHIIINESSSNLRSLGRQCLAGKWKEAVIVVILFNLCLDLPSLLMDAFFGYQVELFDYNMGNLGTYTFATPQTSPLTGIFLLLVMGPFTLGVTSFFLALFRRKKTEVTQVFSGFEFFGKAFCLSLLYAVFVCLWLLLFVVPGIIAAYRYSQAFYIMVDHPEMTAMECINESKKMMVGNKGKLFCLHLTFIGWGILAMIPPSIISVVFLERIDATGLSYFGQSIVAWIAAAGVFWVSAYVQASITAFYEILTGKLKADVYVPGEY